MLHQGYDFIHLHTKYPDPMSHDTDERSVTRGGLGHLRGEDFMPVLLNAAERTNTYEMRLLPQRRLYRPRPDQLQALQV